ncbi:MAG: hypothetical protein R6X19_10160 [Kiritimatiellia bacterium]
MTAPRDQLAALLAPFAPRLLDASARGSGWNSIWSLSLPGNTVVLKIYGRRRARFREWSTDLSQRLGGRTGYTARARHAIEKRGLRLWRESGFDVPALLQPGTFPLPPLPAPFLLMEYVPGPTLSDFLADPQLSDGDKEARLRAFAAALSARHTVAIAMREPALLQEHPGLEHVLVSGARLVTFDLETAFTSRAGVPNAVSAEIAGTVRSLYRRLPVAAARHYLGVLVSAYPDRARLEQVAVDLFENPSPARRALHALDRRLLRKPGRLDKYAAARLLREALGRGA